MKVMPQTIYYRHQLKVYREYLQQLGYSPATQQGNTSCLKYFFLWLEQNSISGAEQIQTRHIKQYYNHEEERPNRKRAGTPGAAHIATALNAIRIWLHYLQQTSQITTNPMSAIRIGNTKREPRDILTPDEIRELYGACRNLRERALLNLLYGCGLRKSEAIKLDINDVHFKSGMLYVCNGKGGKRRAIPMSTTVSNGLREYYLHERSHSAIKRTTADHELAFILGRTGKRISNVRNRLNAIIERTTIRKPVTPHTLRHSIATHLLSGGMSMEYVREFLGHKQIDTTQIYTRVTAHQLKDF